jgi:hypothetical protein
MSKNLAKCFVRQQKSLMVDGEADEIGEVSVHPRELVDR